MIVNVIGAGLAGSEVAYNLGKRNVRVRLYEMRPLKMTEVHKTGYFAELVCSNSLKSEDLTNAEGLLKAEMKMMGSVTLEAAEKARVPSGKALAVDRNVFAKEVTKVIESLETVEIVRKEVVQFNPSEEIWVIATGPATSESFLSFLKEFLGEDFLFFFDAVSPIVTFESIDMSCAFWGDRFGKGKDYINCPLTKEEYEELWRALVEAEVIEMEDFDRRLLFERCQPIEEIARSGKDALRYGPLRPTGLVDPRTGEEPYAVVQLRREDKDGKFYSLVGFQTRLKWGEQKKVLKKIPCLRNAEIVRYGVMHRNIYINSPKVLDVFFRSKRHPNVFFAGQITGVEGYMESAASGIYVAYNVNRILHGLPPLKLPEETMMGALFSYIIERVEGNLKPMYANFGLLPPLHDRTRGKFERRKLLANRALKAMKEFLEANPW
ncbi:methylenetetrahydrofolate--tRNA-(uracil(54)-C(5))-methyltransferase (FADH(2)-oxidizing) TrmFO [Thermotoga sp. KOL6]|uniref:methylenetetrahydrofolate--tRNA-(uracil(54)- C(5))-methyltransferase (FADH(2)-oxidizing) TrmFO n=1 Tax=Thermotoga sp. KOL6 TaxID=126741 RepID=UPI000C788FFE|nr:methylenetetrahydrofolate--tRNA-(uracil(54)-C(5))-methyltransferase (FADH(2)-oxidizing) TrmFO [Thermotoga sp. KOL6]PLV59434.1 tRNA (uracil-5-)-methyltransferase [Thermotoga sp. KOL6]